MPVKTAWPGAVWLLASALLSTSLAAEETPGTELAQTKAQILRCDDGSLTPQEDEEVCARAVDRLWELMRQSVVGFLSAHPKASAGEVQAHLTSLVEADGVTDLGHALDQPLLKFVDDLLARVIRRQDTSAAASPRARAKLDEVIAGLVQEYVEMANGLEAPRIEELMLGMIMNWKVVAARGKQRRVDLEPIAFI
jgi:hypothetical protein